MTGMPTGSGLHRWSHAARRWAIITLLTVLLAAALAAVAPTAAAHNALVSSNPAADSVISEAPGSIELVFDQNIKDFQPKIAITITGNAPVEIIPAVNGPTVTADLSLVDLPESGGTGEPVSWRVGYRVVSGDGHPVTGLLNFSVGSGVAPTIDAGQPATTPTADRTGQDTSVGTAGGTVASSEDGQGFWWIIGVGLLVLGVVAAVAVAVRRRRSHPVNGR